MATEMRCYRRILHIRWQQRITNEEVRRRVKCQRNVLQMVMERKLNFFGHVCMLTADKTSRIRPGRRDWNPRKTQQRMA